MSLRGFLVDDGRSPILRCLEFAENGLKFLIRDVYASFGRRPSPFFNFKTTNGTV